MPVTKNNYEWPKTVRMVFFFFFTLRMLTRSLYQLLKNLRTDTRSQEREFKKERDTTTKGSGWFIGHRLTLNSEVILWTLCLGFTPTIGSMYKLLVKHRFLVRRCCGRTRAAIVAH